MYSSLILRAKATGKYSDKPETFIAEYPGGPLTDADYKYADVMFDPKTGDLTYYLDNGSKTLQRLDGRVEQTIGIEPNATKTYSDAAGNIVRVTSASGVESTYKYDANNTLVETNGPMGNFKRNAEGTGTDPWVMLRSINVRAADGSMAVAFRDGTKIDGAS